MITNAIKHAFNLAGERHWDKIYWAVDIHGVVIKPNWSRAELPLEMYDGAAEVLKKVSDRADVLLILYTCSWPEEIEKYLDFFKKQGINFEYVNKNPEVTNAAYGCYDDKFYFNVLLEDKAGFDPFKDWSKILDLLNKTPELEYAKRRT